MPVRPLGGDIKESATASPFLFSQKISSTDGLFMLTRHVTVPFLSKNMSSILGSMIVTSTSALGHPSAVESEINEELLWLQKHEN